VREIFALADERGLFVNVSDGGHFENLGVYELVIRRSGIDDRYRLTLERELIRVASIGVPRVSITSDTLLRRTIPNTFAVRCSDATWVCARVFRELGLVSGIRPFVDGRSDMYGDDVIVAYKKITEGDPAVFADSVRRWNIRWAILPLRYTKLIALLDHSPEWRRIYVDKMGAIYVRN